MSNKNNKPDFVEKISKLALIKLDRQISPGIEIADKLALIQNNYSEAVYYLNKIISKESVIKAKFKLAKSIYERKVKELLATNIQVKEAPSKDERVAIAEQHCTVERDEMDEMEQKLLKVDGWKQICNNTISVLKLSRDQLNEQIALLRNDYWMSRNSS